MIKKTIGYVVTGIGILILLLSYEAVRAVLKLPLGTGITSNTFLIISVIVIVLGIIILAQAGSLSSNKMQEVPIYHGKEVVGFRKIKK